MSQKSSSIETWYCYQMGPIDWLFGTIPVSDAIAQLQEDDEFARSNGTRPNSDISYADFRKLWHDAESALRQSDLGWEGDDYWSIFALPNPRECAMHIVFLVQQVNDGLTFVVSPLGVEQFKEASAACQAVSI